LLLEILFDAVPANNIEINYCYPKNYQNLKKDYLEIKQKRLVKEENGNDYDAILKQKFEINEFLLVNFLAGILR
jgi:hypothetical protein